MSATDESPVFMHSSDDPGMVQAIRRAQDTFRYFWRELSWEYRRIIPAFGMTAVKMAFTDGDRQDPSMPDAEQMWVSDIAFDGRDVSGTLLNSPNWLKTVKEGDRATRPLDEISDWMLTFEDRVYGGFTVQHLRSTMSEPERKQHDEAWGLDFGDPARPLIAPAQRKAGSKPGFFGRLLGGKAPTPEPLPEEIDPPVEHPMSENMAPSLAQAVDENPSFLNGRDDNGLSTLHSLALAGSTAGVRVMLEKGADPNLKTDDGRTALDLARAMRWDRVIALLEPRTSS